MATDSEQLMREGVATGVETFHEFLTTANWKPADIDRTFCHQVGGGHRKLMLESLGLMPERDFVTFPWLGNTGSVALPVTLAIGLQTGHVAASDKVALLGIGSGINSVMLALHWQTTLVGGRGACPAAPAGPTASV
jgi:3-oxoacyl-[acyl-carrier-protein] synthase-3